MFGVLAPHAVAAQEPGPSTSVLVRVGSGGRPVQGATVSSGGSVTLTDVAGEALLRLPPGAASVRVARIGFRTETVDVSVPSTGTLELAVELEEEALVAEGIVVLSTRSDRRIEDEPLRVEVISREEIEEKLLMTPGDIAMLLAEAPGIRVQPAPSAVGGAGVRVRGLRGRYTMILADGLPLYGGQGGSLGPLQIPPMDLAQVEVIKGTASALYGSSALGGVINLVSRRPEPERELLLNGTTLGGADAVLWLAGHPGGELGLTFLGGVHHQRPADVDGDGWADVAGHSRLTARPRLFWSDGGGRSVLATLGVMAEDREGGTVGAGRTPDGMSFPQASSTRRGDAGVALRALLGERRLLAVRGSASLLGHEHRFGVMEEEDRHATAFLEGSLAGTDGRHAWVVGAAVQRDAFRSPTLPAFDFVHAVRSLFAQDELELEERVLLAASARLDVHGVYGTFASPRVSALFRPGEWSVRASAGSGYFAPTPFLEEVEAVGLARLEPLPALEAERAWSASLDVGREAGALEVELAMFGSSIDGAVVARPREGGRLALENAPGPVRTWGAELLARWEEEPLHVTAAYTFTRSTESADAGGRREAPLTPRHAAGVVGAWELEGRGRVAAELYYTGRQQLEDDTFRSSSPGYLLMGVLVEHRLGPLRLFVNVENVLDTRQTRWDRLVRPARSPEGRWTTDVWAPLEGRVVNGGVRWSF